MKLEYLIWIVILLVYAGGFLLKRARMASKTGGRETAKKGPGWKEKLNKFLLSAQQELKTAEPKDSNNETGWERLLPPEDQERESIRERISFEEEKRASDERPSGKTKPAPVNARSERTESAYSELGGLPGKTVYGIPDLRKAIIWSEILAPPLALRDE